MTAAIMTLGLILAAGSAGECPNPAQCPHRGHHHHHNGSGGHHGSGGFILPPGPGDGWGFPNGDPNGAGWYDPAPYLPLGADRTSDYFFPRYFTAPPQQMFLSTYYNAYENKGQRYLPYSGAGGDHPMGGPPLDTAITPMQPYSMLNNSQPVTAAPRLRGRVQAPPLPASGGSGLTP